MSQDKLCFDEKIRKNEFKLSIFDMILTLANFFMITYF